MKANRFLSAFLALLLFLGSVLLLASCQKDPADPKGTSDLTAPQETLPEESDVLPVNPDAKYEDYSFKILVATRSSRPPQDFLYKDDQSVMDKAIYDRNATLLEKHGVLLDVDERIGKHQEGGALLEKSYSASDPMYDYAVVHTYTLAPIASNGELYDMSEIPTLDLTKPWWDQTMTAGVKIAGSVFFTSGDVSHCVDDYMYCVIFNKAMYQEKVPNGPDVYELVREGKWTLDALAEVCSGVKDDLNGDDIMDSNDQYGLELWCDEMYASIQAAGERVAKVNDDGLIELTLGNPRVTDIVDKFTSIEQADWSINFQTMTGGKGWPAIFSEGNAMFLMSLFNEVSRFRDMDTDYGILPNPRFDEKQDRWYCTFSAGLASVSCVPYVLADVERTGTVLDLLGYYSSQTTSPAYYQKTLVGEKVRDEESAFCLDIIFKNKFGEIGHYYTIGNLNTVMYNYVKNGQSGAWASTYEAARSAAEARVAQLNAQIEKLKKQY
ncbi:MAG: hypothetical protein IJR89_05500 [Clostridia bacterium]|nr:hypothetical protein [Clostridia bacterium]